MKSIYIHDSMESSAIRSYYRDELSIDEAHELAKAQNDFMDMDILDGAGVNDPKRLRESTHENYYSLYELHRKKFIEHLGRNGYDDEQISRALKAESDGEMGATRTGLANREEQLGKSVINGAQSTESENGQKRENDLKLKYGRVVESLREEESYQEAVEEERHNYFNYISRSAKAERSLGLRVSLGSVNELRERWEESRKKTKKMIFDLLRDDAVDTEDLIRLSWQYDIAQIGRLQSSMASEAKRLAGLSFGEGGRFERAKKAYWGFVDMWARWGGEEKGKGRFRKAGILSAIGAITGGIVALATPDSVTDSAELGGGTLVGTIANGGIAATLPRRLMAGKLSYDSSGLQSYKADPQMEKRKRNQVAYSSSVYSKRDDEDSLDKVLERGLNSDVSGEFFKGTEREVRRNQKRMVGAVAIGLASSTAGAWLFDHLDLSFDPDEEVKPSVTNPNVDADDSQITDDSSRPDREHQGLGRDSAEPSIRPYKTGPVPIDIAYANGYNLELGELMDAYGYNVEADQVNEFYQTEIEPAISDGTMRPPINVHGHPQNAYWDQRWEDWGIVDDGKGNWTAEGIGVIELWLSKLTGDDIQEIMDRRPKQRV